MPRQHHPKDITINDPKLKVVRPVCCGMDIHKDIIVATIGTTNMETGITSFLQETFTTLNPELLRLKNWLVEHECFDACMESTGKYWVPIFNVLEDKINLCLTHPKYVKAIKGKKTDKRDSQWICELFKYDLVRSSYIPNREIRELRDICRYRYKLVCMRSSERNRYQNCMTMSNIGIGSVFSDPFGKTAQAIMKEVMTSKTIDDQKILSLVHGRCKNKDKVLDAIHGCEIHSDQRFKITECQTHMDELDKHIDNCEAEMFKRAIPFMNDFIHITELPGISLMSAIMIISEIGVDMNQFDDDKQLISWAGLCPANNESANKKKSTKISKAGQYLKPMLIQCALSAVKNENHYFGSKYKKIKKRRGHKKAIIAIARMMLTSIYHMILTGEAFNPKDIDSFKRPQKTKDEINQMTEESCIEFLKKQGYTISK